MSRRAADGDGRAASAERAERAERAAPEAPDPAQLAEFEALLQYMKRSRGFDFGGYKRASLMRRIDKRMQGVGVAGYAAYVDYLEVHPDEFEQLFNSVLINVTGFFRDPEAWEHVAREIVPTLLAAKRADEQVRVWSAGCATGEEAYTLAIVLAEALGVEGFRERVKIYATDIDEDALTQARQAAYSDDQLADVPAELREKYFEPSAGGRFTFRGDLRRAVIFGRHNLATDAPISRVDLLVCRNALMYFNAEAQYRILVRFHFALNEGGTLFLGRAETLLARTSLFTPLDLKRRLFGKVARPGYRDRLLAIAEADRDDPGRTDSVAVRLREAAFEMGPVAQVVVDQDGLLAAANERARTLFGLAAPDVGRPLQDLQLSYRPIDLRSRIDELYVSRRPVVVTDVAWTNRAGEARSYDIQVASLGDGDGALGVTVTFTDTTSTARLQRELEHANQELETAYEELQSTNEELETTNEELQSTVEELETTNEELQSTNEELETMNEELQSTNEELQAINEESRRRSDQIGETNEFLEAILTSLRGSVIVIDRAARVVVWNPQATEMWGLRPDEVIGRPLFSLDVGLPVAELTAPVNLCLTGASALERITVDAVSRRGRALRCDVSCVPLRMTGSPPRGVVITVE
ncbi:MAG: Multidomain signal transduction protein including CheB-like methylesterase, CheR-like methyltransferase and BaeS-like histidine kinase [uncultured Gemmatimonadaceae bacterium]|uniref:protein-glutamate O-methyltransferase n=1 Tax=uncultured Gemmatimonadaceae bacterium TaxID=246130 RepID=A0A6J4LJ17_9BACT|nr:MAG: Multidomain signal transduction protein including CheB-like methylesterase, CheR-like methyltransferase and BaeS-like histidine kinase [uncultured Gemmatimonadaceae bacterium]